MSRRARQRRERHDTVRLDAVLQPTAIEFAEALEHNESIMSEHAAMAVTCEQFGIDEMDGYELLMSQGEAA